MFFRDKRIYLVCDEPNLLAQAVVSGPILIRGWALAKSGIDKIEVYVDNQLGGLAAYGHPRPDVAADHPDFDPLEAKHSGFGFEWDSTLVQNGEHNLLLRAFNKRGRVQDLAGCLIVDNVISDQDEDQSEQMFFVCDEPNLLGETVISGWGVLRGWALACSGIDRIEIYVDGQPVGLAEYGGYRPDVGSGYPDFEEARRSGFVFGWDSTTVEDGKCKLSLRAISRGGNVQELSGWVTVDNTTARDARKLDDENAQAPGIERVQGIQQKIAPLRLKVSPCAPRRVNLLIPTIDFNYFYAGYIAKFSLAWHLVEAGFKLRLVIVDYCDFLPSMWKQRLKTYRGLEDVLDHVELAYAFDREVPLEVNPDDTFVATPWWTAHIAYQATKDLNKHRFLYLIQDFDPFTFPMGTLAALAAETYTFPHYPIFATEILRDYFRKNGLGVFEESLEAGERNSVAFDNAINPMGPITVNDIANRSPKKLLFYARPEQHAARNMFEMGVLAVAQAIKAGYFDDDEWEFHGFGTVATSAKIGLSDKHYMQLMPTVSHDSYRELLRSHDLGLSFLYTPHPGVVPFEMASAGMLVLTNTFANNKTKDVLSAASSNIIPVEPTIEGVQRGLGEAVANIHDYERRVQGSQVKWSTSWEQSFNDEVVAKIKKFIEAA